jgi:hypothetical protein
LRSRLRLEALSRSSWRRPAELCSGLARWSVELAAPQPQAAASAIPRRRPAHRCAADLSESLQIPSSCPPSTGRPPTRAAVALRSCPHPPGPNLSRGGA